MAKIHEEYVVVKISKLVKDDAADVQIASDEIKAAIGELLSQAVADLTGDASLIVEVDEGAI